MWSSNFIYLIGQLYYLGLGIVLVSFFFSFPSFREIAGNLFIEADSVLFHQFFSLLELQSLPVVSPFSSRAFCAGGRAVCYMILFSHVNIVIEHFHLFCNDSEFQFHCQT